MIVGIVGKAGSGKDTAVGFLKKLLGEDRSKEFKFSSPLKAAAYHVFKTGTNEEYDSRLYRAIYGSSSDRNMQLGNFVTNDGLPLTIRYVLQQFGTEFGREICHKNLWVDLCLRNIAMWQEGDISKVALISDCRFINEAKAIRDHNGLNLKIVRPNSGLKGSASQHQSEMEMDSNEMSALIDLSIDNSGTLINLENKLAEVIEELSL